MYSITPAAVKWFPVDSVEEARAFYRALALRFHPDRGGDTAVMAEINLQYEAFLKRMDGQVSKSADGKSHVYRYRSDREKAILAIIDQLLHLRLPDVDILLIGWYVWVLGLTPQHAPVLDGLGLLWHDKRHCWYFRPADLPRAIYSGVGLGLLAQVYGYQHFVSDPRTALTAN